MGNKRNLSSPHIPEGMGERLVEREFSSLFTKFLPLFHDSLYWMILEKLLKNIIIKYGKNEVNYCSIVFSIFKLTWILF